MRLSIQAARNPIKKKKKPRETLVILSVSLAYILGEVRQTLMFYELLFINSIFHL